MSKIISTTACLLAALSAMEEQTLPDVKKVQSKPQLSLDPSFLEKNIKGPYFVSRDPERNKVVENNKFRTIRSLHHNAQSSQHKTQSQRASLGKKITAGGYTLIQGVQTAQNWSGATPSPKTSLILNSLATALEVGDLAIDCRRSHVLRKMKDHLKDVWKELQEDKGFGTIVTNFPEFVEKHQKNRKTLLTVFYTTHVLTSLVTFANNGASLAWYYDPESKTWRMATQWLTTASLGLKSFETWIGSKVFATGDVQITLDKMEEVFDILSEPESIEESRSQKDSSPKGGFYIEKAKAKNSKDILAMGQPSAQKLIVDDAQGESEEKKQKDDLSSQQERNQEIPEDTQDIQLIIRHEEPKAHPHTIMKQAASHTQKALRNLLGESTGNLQGPARQSAAILTNYQNHDIADERMQTEHYGNKQSMAESVWNAKLPSLKIQSMQQSMQHKSQSQEGQKMSSQLPGSHFQSQALPMPIPFQYQTSELEPSQSQSVPKTTDFEKLAYAEPKLKTVQSHTDFHHSPYDIGLQQPPQDKDVNQDLQVRKRSSRASNSGGLVRSELIVINDFIMENPNVYPQYIQPHIPIQEHKKDPVLVSGPSKPDVHLSIKPQLHQRITDDHGVNRTINEKIEPDGSYSWTEGSEKTKQVGTNLQSMNPTRGHIEASYSWTERSFQDGDNASKKE